MFFSSIIFQNLKTELKN